MGSGGQSRRQKRHPLTPEEVADIVAYRRRRELERLSRFLKTTRYRWLNIFLLCCFFVYFELLFCFAGPCRYDRYVVQGVEVDYAEWEESDERRIRDIEVESGGQKFVFMVKGEARIPLAGEEFSIGADFLLGKDLKGLLPGEDRSFRLFSASPVLLLCGIAFVVSFVAFLYNLNQNSYSLTAMAVLNGITVFGILLL